MYRGSSSSSSHSSVILLVRRFAPPDNKGSCDIFSARAARSAQRGRRKTLDARPRRHPEPFSPELAPSSTPAPSAPGAIAYLALAEEAIFSMLCTIVNSCHWAFTFRRPRNVKRRIPLF